MSPTFLVDKNFTSDQSSIFLFYICSLNRLVLKVLFSSAIKNLGVNSLMSIASDFSLCPLTLLDQRTRSHHLFCILHAIFTTFYSPNLFSETRRSSFLLPPFPSFSLMVAAVWLLRVVMQEAEIKIESDDFSSRDVGNALIHKLIPLFRW